MKHYKINIRTLTEYKHVNLNPFCFYSMRIQICQNVQDRDYDKPSKLATYCERANMV